MQTRRRFKQTQSLDERLLAHATRLRAEALRATSHAERERLDRLARHAETASHMNGWLSSSPGSQPSTQGGSGRTSPSVRTP